MFVLPEILELGVLRFILMILLRNVSKLLSDHTAPYYNISNYTYALYVKR
jgi:hypothetical protein